MAEVAAALASLAQGKTPLMLGVRETAAPHAPSHAAASPREPRSERGPPGRSKGRRFGPQETYRLEVGRRHDVQPGNLVGALANEADLDGSEINGLEILDDHSFVRLPAGMPPAVLTRLRAVRVKGQALALTLVERRPAPGKKHKKKPPSHRGRDSHKVN